MDNHFRIQAASLDDVAELAELERACFSDPWTEAGIRETLQYETARAFIARNSSRIVGYVLARISGKEGEILDLAVLPEVRRQGIARKLLAHTWCALDLAGVKEVYLEVRASNAPAIELYRGEGFRPVGIRQRYYRNPAEDALVLRAVLPPCGIMGS